MMEIAHLTKEKSIRSKTKILNTSTLEISQRNIYSIDITYLIEDKKTYLKKIASCVAIMSLTIIIK